MDARRNGTGAGQRTAFWPGAFAEGQKALEAAVAVGELVRVSRLGPAGIGDRVHDTIQDQRANAPREHRGVGLPDEGARGVAHISELRVADEPAQIVEIADGVGGGDVAEKRAADLTTASRERGRLAADETRSGSRRGNRPVVEEPQPAQLGAKAVNVGAVDGAANVPADDVESAL